MTPMEIISALLPTTFISPYPMIFVPGSMPRIIFSIYLCVLLLPEDSHCRICRWQSLHNAHRRGCAPRAVLSPAPACALQSDFRDLRYQPAGRMTYIY